MTLLELNLQRAVEAVLKNPELSDDAIREIFKAPAQDSKTGIPSFLTPEKTLRIYEEIMKNSVTEIKHTLLDLKVQGPCFPFPCSSH